MVFVSGYHANIGIFNVFCQEEDVILSDSLNHASIIDGMRLSKAKRLVYRHCSLKDLEKKLI
jgi:7-keto-8-aminopelargonate synthetase-like enzyme